MIDQKHNLIKILEIVKRFIYGWISKPALKSILTYNYRFTVSLYPVMVIRLVLTFLPSVIGMEIIIRLYNTRHNN